MAVNKRGAIKTAPSAMLVYVANLHGSCTDTSCLTIASLLLRPANVENTVTVISFMTNLIATSKTNPITARKTA